MGHFVSFIPKLFQYISHSVPNNFLNDEQALGIDEKNALSFQPPIASFIAMLILN